MTTIIVLLVCGLTVVRVVVADWNAGTRGIILVSALGSGGEGGGEGGIVMCETGNAGVVPIRVERETEARNQAVKQSLTQRSV